MARLQSPSLRRVWVEIANSTISVSVNSVSPSLRRVWVEIYKYRNDYDDEDVTLLAEGVG